MSIAYYNEIDPYAAQWLRNLIIAGRDVPGIVDERSIEDVKPSDLTEFTQCHFFAGIGVWSLALRNAGWPDQRRVWTGSCPCQPFSAAGQGAGFADERHLWPAFQHLIGERRPAIVLGEQVASSDVNPWIDLVQDDLEGLGYRVGAVPFPSAGVGAPHIRDRLYWVANAGGARLEERERIARVPGGATGRGSRKAAVGAGICNAGGVADNNQHGCTPDAGAELYDAEYHIEPRSGIRGLADAGAQRYDGSGAAGAEDGARGGRPSVAGHGDAVASGSTGPTNGYWRDADWLGCRDGKWRPVEPGTFPLAHGAAARVGRLRAYGNAINAEAARVFIQSVMTVLN